MASRPSPLICKVDAATIIALRDPERVIRAAISGTYRYRLVTSTSLRVVSARLQNLGRRASRRDQYQIGALQLNDDTTTTHAIQSRKSVRISRNALWK